MPQPDFVMPDFLLNNSAEEIHERMMNNLPADIDDMPGGFPYDFTMPAALEKDEFINYHLVRALMIAFPQYAWDEWLDLHGQQVHIERHQPQKASGKVKIVTVGAVAIGAGTIFCTPATDTGPAIEFATLEDVVIRSPGEYLLDVSAVESGPGSNVAAGTIVIMAKPEKNITEITNPEDITGGTERESNDDYYDRIAAEYDNKMSYVGNDSDYIRWAKEAGAGDCIVSAAWDGPGTVKLVLVDGNGEPANEKLIEDVYNHIVSPNDRSQRLLPTACARLTCAAATTVSIDYKCTGLLYDATTDIERIKADFEKAVKSVYSEAKNDGILRYNNIRPLITSIPGVEDFDTFLVNGGIGNIKLEDEEYPKTGTVDFG